MLPLYIDPAPQTQSPHFSNWTRLVSSTFLFPAGRRRWQSACPPLDKNRGSLDQGSGLTGSQEQETPLKTSLMRRKEAEELRGEQGRRHGAAVSL